MALEIRYVEHADVYEVGIPTIGRSGMPLFQPVWTTETHKAAEAVQFLLDIIDVLDDGGESVYKRDDLADLHAYLQEIRDSWIED